MALRVTPAASHPHHTIPETGAPSAPGVHDTLRSRLGLTHSIDANKQQSQSSQLQSAHPLESRLRNWRKTQDELKMQLLRREFGVAEPVKRRMELDICEKGDWRPACLGGEGRTGGSSGLHADILAGRDCEIGWEDVFVGDESAGFEAVGGFHGEMEKKFGMGW